jgi:tellurite resistance protein
MTLGLLVGRFGDFVREQYVPPQAVVLPDTPFPKELSRLRQACAHHLIPLALLSRADGDFAEAEQEAIIAHCVELVRASGTPATEAEVAALREYLAELEPSIAQLEPALKRVEHESAEAVASLLTAAQAVVDADGKRDPAETKLLAGLQSDLKAL